MNTYKTIGLVVLALVLNNFKANAQKTEKELIIGRWMPDGVPNARSVFDDKGQMRDYYKGVLEDTYTYTVYTEETLLHPAGKSKMVDITYLKLIDNKTKHVLIYQFVDLNEHGMGLLCIEGALSRVNRYKKVKD